LEKERADALEMAAQANQKREAQESPESRQEVERLILDLIFSLILHILSSKVRILRGCGFRILKPQGL
jgi:hypothetical protein